MTPEELAAWHRQQADQRVASQNRPDYAAQARQQADDIYNARMAHARQQDQVRASDLIRQAVEGAQVQSRRVAYERQHHTNFWPVAPHVQSYHDARNHAIKQHNDWRAEQSLWYRITHRKW